MALFAMSWVSISLSAAAADEQLEWLEEQRARWKAPEFGQPSSVMAGYPEHEDDWIDYSGVRIAPDDFFGNVSRLREFEKRRNLDLLGKIQRQGRARQSGRRVYLSVVDIEVTLAGNR